ncbi:hypothetical protein LTR37_013309 [Vermiconidia calcicola]|uniref:Uncharacterized protein n=1 Tax=Vermiconidia calcicola TaxID=1690605 RepID=A0ACC3MWW5_9PEZI|nr:hypothetical protein LTR37_013309 [Vermiconidia calcicola]
MMFQMDSLKETVEANTIQMKSLSGKVNGFHGKVHTLTRQTKSLNGKIDELETSLGEEQKRSTALEERSTALQDRVDDLGAEGVDLQTQVANLRHYHLVDYPIRGIRAKRQADATNTQEHSFSQCTRLDILAESLKETPTSDPFGRFLAERDLSSLNSCYDFALDAKLREQRNKQAYEDQWKVFAYAVVRGRELGDDRCTKVYENYRKAFEFTYNATWEQARDHVA